MSNFCGNCGYGAFGGVYCQRCGNKINNNNNSFNGPTFPVQQNQPNYGYRVQQNQPTFGFGVQQSPTFGFGGAQVILTNRPTFPYQGPIFVTNGNNNRPLVNGNHHSNSHGRNCRGGSSVHVNCVSCMKMGL